ncbi:hypothetical protein D9756_003587 [Leucocoprinus leucothites]|uniref:Galactokinase n=1 Tax=Leucocoprinus leucothites TaxID=201217 RepID=A0A8H5LJF2_9AGAR|nr:hypothetical protein D9756_003587 [Leucoagaricus leucothites]
MTFLSLPLYHLSTIMLLADQPIPVYTDLTSLYGSLGSSLNHAERWDALTREFTQRFGRPPAYIARAPGRVNLIGEHIDYALFGVLPAAIERDILIACAPRTAKQGSTEVQDQPGSVILENLNSKYGRQVFAPRLATTQAWHLDIDTSELRWESYVKAGYYGVLSHYFPNKDEEAVPVDMLVTGSVPPGSGVSSSAAMVVASTLAFLAVNNKVRYPPLFLHRIYSPRGHARSYTLRKGDLVTMAMENEKRVGVNSGGMDQAASILSTPSSSLYITFYPTLSGSPAPLPRSHAFVIANSLVVSDKATTAKHRYNLRVVETLVGARVLAKNLGVTLHDSAGKHEKVTYREVLGRLVGEVQGSGSSGDMGVEALIVALKSVLTKLGCLLPKGVSELVVEGGAGQVQLGVTMEEMVEMSGLSRKAFEEVYLSWVEGAHVVLGAYKHIL